MKTIKSILYLLLALFLFSGADCTTEEEYIYMTEDFKDHIMFPVGSYWVYQDSASGRLDTVELLDQSVEESYNLNTTIEKLFQELSLNSDSTIRAYTMSSRQYYGFGYYIDVTLVGDRYGPTHDSLQVMSNYYFNVKEIQKITGHYNYWVKNIGLVKKVTPEGTMLLTDYYINE